MDMKRGYLKTEAGVVPLDWTVSRLGSLADTGSGTTPARAMSDRYYRNGNSPWVKTMDLSNGDLSATSESVTRIALEECNLKVYPEGTVLVAMYGGFSQIGRTGLLCIPATVNQAIAAILIKSSDLVPEYLLEMLNYRVGYWRRVASSSRKDPNISRGEVERFPVAYPDPPEQHAIVEALRDVDGQVGGLDRLILKKRNLKRAVAQQLLTGQIRLPGFRGRWMPKKLSELLRYERPDAFLVKNADYAEGGDTPVLTANKSFVLGHTNEQFGVYEGVPAIIFDDFTTDSKYVDFPFKVKSSAIKILTPRDSGVCLRFVSERMRLFRFPVGEHRRYYISDYQHIELPAPGADEQAAIAAVLSDMDAELSALVALRDKTKDLKQAMMQELLTGKTRLVPTGAADA
jgi:type I restriction enzyme S subunit